MKICRTCGRKKHEGLCDMAELDDGHIVHVSRVDIGGDLHDKVRVKNRWIKPEAKKKTKARKT